MGARRERDWVIGRGGFLAGAAFAFIAFAAGAQGARAADSMTQAVGVLEHERSASEQYAVILATVGRGDVNRYLRGIQLYAEAKADFDALIAQLRLSLITGADPGGSKDFAAALSSAAAKRIAFTDFVTKEVIGPAAGMKPGLPDVIAAAPELVKALTEAGIAIWEAYRKADKDKRDALLDEVDHLRWRSFADLAGPKP